MEDDRPGFRELVCVTAPALHTQWLQGSGDPCPRIAAGTRDRHWHGSRAEDLADLPQDPDDVVPIVVHRADALVARVAKPVLRRDVDGGVTVAVNAIHRVAARVECEVADEGVGVDLINARERSHGFSGGVSGELPGPPGILEELTGLGSVELRHANLDREQVIGLGPDCRRGSGVAGSEDMPRMGAHLWVHDWSFPEAEAGGQAVFQVDDLLPEACVREGLRFWEDEAPSGVPAWSQREAEVVGEGDQRADRFEELGGAARLDDDLSRVNE